MALVALLVLAWAFRFDYIKADSRAFYKVNRWTGTTYLCLPAGCREVLDR